MSLKIIKELINFIIVKLDVDEENVIIKNIEIKDDCEYTIKLKIKDNLYSIRHFEPFLMVQNVNYGMGPVYDCSIFNKEKGHYEKI
jgi:hypothetical protein